MRRGLALGIVAAVVVGAALLAAHAAPTQAQPVATIALPAPGTPKQLYEGCNNIGLTFPEGTSSQEVVQAVMPAGAVESMWRHNAALNQFVGFSPAAPQVSDLLTVSFMDAVWLCVTAVPGGAALPPPVHIITPEPLPVTPPGSPMVELEVLSVDISKATIGTPPATDTYTVTYWAYDPADMANKVCSLDSPAASITASDPPPAASNFTCLVPGNDFRLEVIVQVDHCSGGICWSEVSAGAFDGVAPAQQNQWQSATLDSKDAFVLQSLTVWGDDPDLEFTVDIRFRSIVLVPL
jgi:hypothetical protein